GEILRRLVLYHAPRPCGNPVVPAILPVHPDFVQGTVPQTPAPIAVVQKDAPHAVGTFGQRKSAAVPAVEIAEQEHLPCAGKPLAEPPSVRLLVALESEIAVTVGITGKTARYAFNLAQGFHIEPPAVIQFLGRRLKPWVVFN